MSTEQVFSAMNEAIQKPALAKKFRGTVLFKVGDENFLLRMEGGENFTRKLSDEGGSNNVDLTVIISKENMIKLVSSESKITPQQAFMKGMLKVKGKVSLAMKLTVIFNATKKSLQSKSKL